MLKNVVYPESPFLAIPLLLAVAIINVAAFVLRLSYRTFVIVGYTIVKLLVKTLAAFSSEKQQKKAARKIAKSTQVEAAADFQDTIAVPAYRAQSGEFKVADRIIAIGLEPAGASPNRAKGHQYVCNSIAVLNLRIYYGSKTVSRDMIITDRRLREIMKTRRHSFPDASFEPSKGLTQIKDETVQLAQELFNSLGNVDVKAQPLKREVVESKVVAEQTPSPKTTEPPVQTSGHSFKSESKRDEVPDLKPRERNHFNVQPGITYSGTLVAAGEREFRPAGSKPYKSFEARLRMANGVDLPLRGSELDRELTAKAIKLGDRVEITQLGKVPVDLPNGSKGSKNMYEVRKL